MQAFGSWGDGMEPEHPDASVREALLGFQSFKKDIDRIAKLLREISSLDQDRVNQVKALQARLSKLTEAAQALTGAEAQHRAVSDCIAAYQQKVKDTLEEIRKRFGAALEEYLRKDGLDLSGQYPNLRAGLFTVVVDSQAARATIWFGPKQERLDTCEVSAPEVAKRLKKCHGALGSLLEPEDFARKLEEGHVRLAGAESGRPVPIISLLAEVAFLVQPASFRQDPRRESYQSYGRADFSYDLFRCRHAARGSGTARKPHLVVATRSHTRRRGDFLWIPESQDGKGTCYSHLHF